MAAGLANDRPPGRQKLANAPPSGLTIRANALHLPEGGMGTPGIDWCIKRNTSILKLRLVSALRRVSRLQIRFRIWLSREITDVITSFLFLLQDFQT